jgi:hypothetical protein
MPVMRPLSDIGQKLDRAGEIVDRATDTMGRTGAFGLTAAVLASKSPGMAEKMRVIQNVYDNFGHQATTNLMGAYAVNSVVKRLPGKLTGPLRAGASAFLRNKPLLSRVISFAGQVARAV